jgi:hypothetical protein
MKQVSSLKLVLVVAMLAMFGFSLESGRAQQTGVPARFESALNLLQVGTLLSVPSDSPGDDVQRVQFPLPQMSGQESGVWINKTNAALLSAIRTILQTRALQDRYTQKERQVVDGVPAEQAGVMTILVRSVFIQNVLGR